MTETDELRRLLDERGVEWKQSAWSDKETFFKANGIGFIAVEGITKLVVRITDYLTPEQAIEVTLGSGTCKWEPADFITEGDWWNTSCGETFTWEPYGTPNYCPNCGRKVVEG